MTRLDLDGRVALVAGGGAGMGASTAILFAERGAAVVVADVDAQAAEATADRIVAADGSATRSPPTWPALATPRPSSTPSSMCTDAWDVP